MIDYGLGVRLKSVDQIPAEKLREWRNDYHIWKWCRQNDLISTWDQINWLQKQERDPAIRMYSIFDMHDRGIGVCGLTSMNLVNRNAEFSLYIAPAFQGEGHGKKALKLLISHGFNAYGLQHIWGESFVNNPATKLFIDLGLSREGIRRNFYFREGRFIDAHLFSILRSEWEKSERFEGCRTPCFS